MCIVVNIATIDLSTYTPCLHTHTQQGPVLKAAWPLQVVNSFVQLAS